MTGEKAKWKLHKDAVENRSWKQYHTKEHLPPPHLIIFNPKCEQWVIINVIIGVRVVLQRTIYIHTYIYIYNDRYYFDIYI